MTSKDLRNFLLLLAALAVLVSPAVAQGRGQGNAHKQQDKNRVVRDDGDQGKNQNRDVGNQKTRKHGADVQGPVFGPHARDIIDGYYRNRYSNLPPGLAKRGGNLPPGLEQQLQRNGTLPPGLQKRLEPFPSDLRRQLPRLPANHAYGVIDGSAIIVNQRTSTIVDVMHDVLSRSGK